MASIAGISKRDFNSTMVRLKDTDVPQSLTEVSEFQFHYGTIKSVEYNNGYVDVLPFQFHYGTIKRP